MDIREAEDRDWLALRQLYLAQRQLTFSYLDTSSYQLSDFESDTEGERLWVASLSTEIIGFISVWPADSFIHHLYVDSVHQGKGVGSQLLAEVQFTYSELSLKCNVQNHKALEFYAAKGFVRDSQGGDGLESYYLMKLN
ncbi:GNAT family N-acetyltransferase [Alginatibacterium sediminis]|uniref:GNAT family N-acetyltransferase n=1 Tax=Alginatibacterium sediminis TaxID=2164068 RepID=A0A420E9P8_9ALTE|nr:GNAT family N-acetyltransferase [Alginatibacterium sediminis]RKF17396.1 GNAT family N-acetyltransferase [Alginatibacterium sediminis]